MTQDRFDTARWVQRLAKALDGVLTYESAWDNALWERRMAERRAMGLASGTHNGATKERIDEYWHVRPARGGGQLTEYEQSLLDLLAHVEEVILEHPTITGCLGSTGEFTGILVYSPASRFPMSMRQVVEGILRYALDCGASEAALSLEKRIRLGQERSLTGSKITLFHGLGVDGSYELPNGMGIASLEEVEGQVDLVTIEHMLLRQRLVRVNPASIGVVCWSYRWGPAIAAPDDEEELEFTELPLDLNEVAGLAVTALGLVCNAPVKNIGSTGDNFDRSIGRALCYKDRFTTLKDLRAKLNLAGGPPDQVLSPASFPQVSAVFDRLMQLRSAACLGESDGPLTAVDISAMCSRYNDFKLEKTRLPDIAYFVLTMLEREFSGSTSDKRRRTADKYAISRNALKRMSRLASNAGGLELARKASGVGVELTASENEFLEQSARQIILRAIEVVAEPDSERKEITLSELYGR